MQLRGAVPNAPSFFKRKTAGVKYCAIISARERPDDRRGRETMAGRHNAGGLPAAE